MANEENLKSWKPGESGNPKGRPRKSFGSINKELKAKGVEPLSKSDLLDAYALVFNSTDKELTELKDDQATPYALTIIIEELKDKRTRGKALQDYRDYVYGRAVENLEINNNVKIFELPSNGREGEDKKS